MAHQASRPCNPTGVRERSKQPDLVCCSIRQVRLHVLLALEHPPDRVRPLRSKCQALWLLAANLFEKPYPSSASPLDDVCLCIQKRLDSVADSSRMYLRNPAGKYRLVVINVNSQEVTDTSGAAWCFQPHTR